jgi:hypothetical protein
MMPSQRERGGADRSTASVRTLCEGWIFVRVLVAANFLESRERESVENLGENATETKHGF